MHLLYELRVFIKGILFWICSFTAVSFFFFLFGAKEMTVFGMNLYLPLPAENSYALIFGRNSFLSLFSQNSFSVQVFNQVRNDMLPSYVQLIATNPLSAFTSQVLLSMLLGFLVTIPLLLYQTIAYLHPALLPRERKVVLWSLPLLILLFIAGVAFSYFFLIPETFKILYPFASGMGVTPFFSLAEFTKYVLALLIGVGLMFLLPVFVVLLSFLGIIKADFWIKKWRFAVMFFLILSAIIAPDVITMFMLFIPLIGIYLAACFFAKKFSGSG